MSPDCVNLADPIYQNKIQIIYQGLTRTEFCWETLDDGDLNDREVNWGKTLSWNENGRLTEVIPMINPIMSVTEISDSKPRDLVLFYKFVFVVVRKLNYDC
jgi:hypothetical protein